MKRSKVVFDEKKPYNCELCGEWVEKYKETNLCCDCGNKVILLKNKDAAVDNLTKFARWCANIGSVMAFVGILVKIWIDSDFINKFITTGLFLFVVANIIYALEAIDEDYNKNKGQVKKW
jgi:DNA-directed RNA polymerase subunit RPC12/RpoP